MLIVGLVAAAGLGFVLCISHASVQVAEANAHAKTAEVAAEAVRTQLAAASDSLQLARTEADSLKSAGQRLKVVYRDRVRDIPPPQAHLPEVCDSAVARGAALESALAAADSLIANQDSTITIQSQAIAAAALGLRQADAALAAARDELAKQSKRTGLNPRKLLGILPMPEVMLGYGATLANGKVQTGPAATIGWRISL